MLLKKCVKCIAFSRLMYKRCCADPHGKRHTTDRVISKEEDEQQSKEALVEVTDFFKLVALGRKTRKRMQNCERD